MFLAIKTSKFRINNAVNVCRVFFLSDFNYYFCVSCEFNGLVSRAAGFFRRLSFF